MKREQKTKSENQPPKTSLKQQMDFFSPEFDKIMVEKGHAQICYPTQPFKYGYKVYWLSSKPPNFGRRHRLSDYEMLLLQTFMGGKDKWDLDKYGKDDLIALEDELTRRCNVQNTKDLTWDEILVRVRRCVQADLDSRKQASDGKVDSPNEKSLETWYWKLYEKTIKAVIAAILDKVNPS